MHDVAIPFDRVQDPFETRVPEMGFGRDPERTPMQWDASSNAGFSEAETWLPVAPDYDHCNVATLKADEGSILNFCRKLIALRHTEDALAAGAYEHFASSPDVFAYIRSDEKKRFLIALNFGERGEILEHVLGTIAISTRLDRERERVADTLKLRPNEGVVALLD
jgi:alpha-glucosidase